MGKKRGRSDDLEELETENDDNRGERKRFLDESSDDNLVEAEIRDEAEVEEKRFVLIKEETEAEKEERFRFDVEEAVADFEDENLIGRHEIPESSDEDEEDELVQRDRRMKRRREGDTKIQLGTTFFTGLGFKEAIVDYVLQTGHNLVQDRWDKDKLSFKCGMGGNCEWRVYCSYDKPRGIWIVKTTNLVHSCTPNGKCKIFKSPVIARVFLDKLRVDPSLMPEKMQEYIKAHYKIISTRSQCQRGRLEALKIIKQEHEDQFTHLRGYVSEVLISNPGSTCFVDTMKNAAGEDIFQRFYVCFDIIRTCWRGSCRPIIGVDGTFLKTAVKGVLLSAIGHDANNQIYPIAWAVAQSENTDTWVWFIKQLKIDLGLENGAGFIILSDRSRGLIHAVKAQIPEAEHRMCVKHIVENLKKNHGKKDLLKPMVWTLAWSYSVEEYRKNLKNLKDYDNALYEAVLREDPETWCLPFYKLGHFCEDVDNNATELFNSCIKKARTKALVPMLETIRRQAMVRITKRKKKANKCKSWNTLYVRDVLAHERKKAEECKTYKCTHGYFEVEISGKTCRVNLPAHTCTCLKWQVSGIPCEHVYGVIIDEGLNVDEYVSEYFSSTMWQLLYDTSIIPLRGPDVWMHTGESVIKASPEPPMPGRKKGDKKKSKVKKYSRIRGKFESPKKRGNTLSLRRTGRIMHCRICKEAGHNSKGCSMNPKKKGKGVAGPSGDAGHGDGGELVIRNMEMED